MRLVQLALIGLTLSSVGHALDVTSKTQTSKKVGKTQLSALTSSDEPTLVDQIADQFGSSDEDCPILGSLGQQEEESFAQVEATKSSSKTTTTKDSDPYGIGEFVLGCILIPFSLVFLWKNEKKIVTFQKCMDRAEKEVVGGNATNVNDDNNFKLVHVSGKSFNKTELVDNQFQVTAEDSYRLKRTVEVYQWQEIREKKEDKVIYKYVQGWYPTRIDSSIFKESGHENPAGEWPFRSNNIEAQNVMLGDYTLNASQISRLGGNRSEKIEPQDDQVNASSQAMTNAGFSEFVVRGNYLVSSCVDNSQVGEHPGQMRVQFTLEKCGTTTVIAQQMQDDDGVHTFRKWNPEKINVPFSESTDAEGDSTCTNPLCCYICLCVNCCFNVMFEETVDHVCDAQKTSAQYFTDSKEAVQTAGKVFRPVGIIACIVGFYSLFAPVIALLNWIPLVGWLLGGIASFAAALFAFIVGGTLSCLMIAIAWVFFRPLIGIPLLLAVGTSCYFIFFYDWGVPVVESETSASTSTSTTSDQTVTSK